MNLGINDFLIKYHSEFLPELYNVSLEQSILDKQEFWSLRLPASEPKPAKPGDLMKSQEIVQRLLSALTPYDEILLMHEPGTGKTCSTVGIIEMCRRDNLNLDKALILASNNALLDNYLNELIFVCTDGRYIPENYDTLTAEQKTIRKKKMVADFYQFDTFLVFAKNLAKLSDQEIIKRYNNMVIVIDEVHNLSPREEDAGVSAYNELKRMIGLLSNRKIVLASATPMQDSPEQIADIMNLILPADRQMPTGGAFRKRYLVSNERGYNFVNPETEDELSQYFRGRISYLKAQKGDIVKKFVGTQNDEMEYFITQKVIMSPFQAENYSRALAIDVEGAERSIYSNSAEAILLTYPDGSWGKEGFRNFVADEKKRDIIKDKIIHVYSLKKEFKDLFVGKSPNNPRDREEMLEIISRFSIKYATVIRSILDNPEKNSFVYIDLVKGSGAVIFSLLLRLFGFSAAKGGETTSGMRYGLLTGYTSTDKQIKDIIQTFNHPSNKNGSRIQVIIGSSKISEGLSFKNIQEIHIVTPHWNYSETEQAIGRGIRLFSHKDLGEGVVVKIHQYLADSRDISFSLDSRMYTYSERKDVSIKNMERLIKTSAIDCSLTLRRNRGSVPGQRECDYMDCDYMCRYSSKNDREADYSSYNRFYSGNRVRELTDYITNELLTNATVSIEHIKDRYPGYSDYEISDTIYSMISSNTQIRNKNGLIGWVKEDSGIVYLSPEFNSGNEATSQYYIFHPVIYIQKSAAQLESEVFVRYMPTIIERMIASRDEDSLREIIISLPRWVQVMFLENAILADEKKIKVNREFRQRLLAYFQPYINRSLEGTIIHTFTSTHRCFDVARKTWSNCPEDIEEMVQESKKEAEETLETNPYGYYGIFKKADNEFQIRDVTSQEAVASTSKSKRSRGKVCSSWSRPALLKVAHAVGLDFPDEFSGKSKQDLITMITDSPKYKDARAAFSVADLKRMDKEQIDRISYYGNKKKGITCAKLREWFEANNLLKVE